MIERLNAYKVSGAKHQKTENRTQTTEYTKRHSGWSICHLSSFLCPLFSGD